MKLKKVLKSGDHVGSDAAGDRYGFVHWCPGCEQKHVIPTSGAVAWSFNEDMEKPTFQPSVRHEWDEGARGSSDFGRKRCHYFIVDGVIQFCGDCTHALSGKNVPLPELP